MGRICRIINNFSFEYNFNSELTKNEQFKNHEIKIMVFNC